MLLWRPNDEAESDDVRLIVVDSVAAYYSFTLIKLMGHSLTFLECTFDFDDWSHVLVVEFDSLDEFGISTHLDKLDSIVGSHASLLIQRVELAELGGPGAIAHDHTQGAD